MLRTKPESELRPRAEAAVRWLASHQLPDGNLADPVTQTPLTPRHYAPALFAAGCTLAGNQAILLDSGKRAVGYCLSVPKAEIGAAELQTLGLLRVYESSEFLSPDTADALKDWLLTVRFASSGSHVTNNWHAMRAVCLAQRGRILQSESDLKAARHCLHHDVLPRQDADGLFPDYPPRIRSRVRMTPLTYHAKTCAMLAMLLKEFPDEGASVALERGVTALANFCAPDGEGLYFGRSCNSIYGYAAALYACEHALDLSVLFGVSRRLVRQASTRMARYLDRMQEQQGYFRAYPAARNGTQGWDDYVNLADYNAFAAFLLLQLPPFSGGWDAEPVGAVRFFARHAGLFVTGSEANFTALSTRGQIHTGSYMFIDARYSGMQVLSLQDAGRTIVPPPPHDASGPTNHDWIGFMPVMRWRDQDWAPRVYRDIVLLENGSLTVVLGRGSPISMRPGLSSDLRQRIRPAGAAGPTGLASNAARFLMRRLQPSFLHPYRAATLHGVEVRRAIVLAPVAQCLVTVDQVRGRVEQAWSTIRLAQAYKIADGSPGDAVRVRIAEPQGIEKLESRVVHTSNGPADVLRIPIGSTQICAVVIGYGTVPLPTLHWDGQGSVLSIEFTDPKVRRVKVNLEAMKVTAH